VTSAPHAPKCPQSIPYEVGSGAPYGCNCRGSEPVEREARACLHELFALVMGECPSLLDEDSGGSADLCLRIEETLRSPAPTTTPEPEQGEPTARWIEHPVPGHYIGPFQTQEETEAYMARPQQSDERMRKALEEIATSTAWDYPALRHIAEMRDRARRALYGEPTPEEAP